MRRLVVALAIAAISVPGSSGTSAGAAPLDPLGYVRLLHGDLGVAGRAVPVSVDGQAAGQALWAGASPWHPVLPGRRRLTAKGGTDVTVDVGAGCGVTIVTGQTELNPASPRATVISDCGPSRLGPGLARITAVVVTGPSFGALEVEVNGGRRMVEPHAVVPGTVVGTRDVHVTFRHARTGAVIMKRDLPVAEGAAYTLALVGGGEAGITLAAVEDAAQARVVPAPGQLIQPRLPAQPQSAPLSPPAGIATPPAGLHIVSLGLVLPVGRLETVTGLPRSLPLRDVAWLTGTAPAGAPGTTAVVGHAGSGPFGRLGTLEPGDRISITDSAGQSHTYRTVSVTAHRKDAFPQEVWAPQRVPTLVLVTCTGGKDPKTGLHRDNLIVRAIAT